MRRIFLLLIVFGFYPVVKGQVTTQNLPGQVSFLSSQNVYVKFKSTIGISQGDTLYSASDGNLTPVLIVNSLSSSSCACTALNGTKLAVADLIIGKARIRTPKKEEAPAKTEVKEIPVTVSPEKPASEKPNPDAVKQRIKGSISAFSYTDFSNTAAKNSQRFRYTFSLDARNIGNSKFSAESYISFKHKTGEWADVKSNIFNALKIYSLAVKYDLNKNTQISFGRKINPRISSIGAMDGLQIENSNKRFAFGAVVGSRPDYTTYGYDSKLFQYGAYMAYNSKTANTYTESSLAFMQQTNNSKTDRRFLYFQHSNSLAKNLFFFSTFEVDLYKATYDSLNNLKPKSTFNPTGMYLSLRYKVTNNLTVSGSYDARKNIMYYESFKTSIDSVFEKELRTGFRLQANYRIARDIMFGIQSGYRFLKSDPHPSKNMYSYLTYSQIPGINISATISATYLQSNYMNGKIFGANITRELFEGKVSTGLGYRYIFYKLPENQIDIKQNIGEMNLSWQLNRNLSLSFNYEGTFEHKNRYNRVYFQFRKRF